MSSDSELQRQQIIKGLAEPGFKFGLGAIAKVSEYAAEGLKNPKVVEAARSVTESVSKNNQFSKLGVGAVAAAAASSASMPVVVPAAIVLGTASLAVYGLAKLAERLSDDV
ncbi:hypothetical protein [Leptothoe sp. PORK10 BA2]|uniref:hypothetical protein n=1 Tax=Leptothoe sp. PORK10 BA2 TaxID=3110254 RepID=UPI002B216A36|nr:hypothetical protein [Leptothoe sp. PORK10 BA2]MEA5467130.1 hypothetical protein [Leptothoe sp. PORK10 BA2]